MKLLSWALHVCRKLEAYIVKMQPDEENIENCSYTGRC